MSGDNIPLVRAVALRAVLLPAMLAWGIGTTARAHAVELEDLIPRIKDSIVAVGTFERLRNPQFDFRGTGFVVGDGTLIATNAHVLPNRPDTERLESVVVALPGAGFVASRRNAKVVMTDQDHDLALLRVEGAALPALRLGASLPKEGQSAAFTGFPIGTVLGLVPTTHRATVSAITPIALPGLAARNLDHDLLNRLQKGVFDVIQLDGTAYPGNSGSPLYDASSGEVFGVINQVFVKTTKENVLSQPSGITFAMPVTYLRDLLERVNSAR